MDLKQVAAYLAQHHNKMNLLGAGDRLQIDLTTTLIAGPDGTAGITVSCKSESHNLDLPTMSGTTQSVTTKAPTITITSFWDKVPGSVEVSHAIHGGRPVPRIPETPQPPPKPVVKPVVKPLVWNPPLRDLTDEQARIIEVHMTMQRHDDIGSFAAPTVESEAVRTLLSAGLLDCEIDPLSMHRNIVSNAKGIEMLRLWRTSERGRADQYANEAVF